MVKKNINFKMNFKYLIILCLNLKIGVFGKVARIVGGETVEIKDYPYMASLRNIMPDYHFCSASIISNKHVLTAAHCLFHRQEFLNRIRVYTGTSTPNSRCGQAHKILSVDIHPAYDPETTTSSHDIAVVVLVEPMVFNEFQKKILLPITNFQTGKFATVLGWGFTEYPSTATAETLQKIRVKLLTESKCQKFFQKPLYFQQFCAMDKKEVGICHGDSGGPLVVNKRVVGISSFNLPCGQGFPDVFINVFDYIGYINFLIEEKQS